MVNPSSNDGAIDNPLQDEGPVKVLLRLIETAAFLRSTDGSFYAQVSAGGRREIYALAPQLRLHDILVRSTRGNRGRILSLQPDRSVDQKRHDMRNLMADEQLGLEPNNTHENTRHAQVQGYQGDGAMS